MSVSPAQLRATSGQNYDQQNIITDEQRTPEFKKKEKSYKLQAASFKRLKKDTI